MTIAEKWNLEFHHVGIAVASIEEAMKSYGSLYAKENFSPIYAIDSQKVNVCFLNVGNKVHLEFIEPSSEESGIHKLLKKGISCYHTAFQCKEIEAVVETMITADFKSMNYFNSAAFDNKRCIFMISPEGHLIELIEQ